MPARLTTVKPVVGVGTTKPVLRVSFVVPVTEVSAAQLAASTVASIAKSTTEYIIPAADVSYVLLTPSAYLDTSGRFQLVQESFVLTDGVYIQLIRVVSDTVAVTDRPRKTLSRPILGDAVVMTDVATTLLTLIRYYADTFGFSENVALSVARKSADTFAVTDLASILLERPADDAYALLDAFALEVIKNIDSPVVTSEYTVFSVDKVLADVPVIIETLALDFSKLLEDSFSTLDAMNLAIEREITDGFGVNDDFDAGDGLVYSFSKGVSNVTMLSDATSRAVDKLLADIASASDSGSLIMQNYCDPTYFAEDYVGVSQTF